MGENPADKSSPAVPARRVVVTPPPVAKSARRTPEQVIANPTSTDAFATPSEAPQNDQVIAGPEPAIFGGLNPPGSAPLPSVPAAPPEVPEAETEDEVTAGPIVRPDVRGMLLFTIRSTPLLLLLLVGGLIFGTLAVASLMPAESYVQLKVFLRSSAADLTDAEAAEEHADVNSALRTYPLRAAAKAVLAERSPNISPGFLDSTTFTDAGDIQWPDAHTLSLRVNTSRPADDGPRLAAVADAFMHVANRDYALNEHKQRVGNLKLHLQELNRQLNDLKSDQARTPGTLPATPEELPATIAQRIETTQAEITREQRACDIFLVPDRIDPAGVQSYDNRQVRNSIMVGLWVGLLVCLGMPIVMNYRTKRREIRSKHSVKRATNPPQPYKK